MKYLKKFNEGFENESDVNDEVESTTPLQVLDDEKKFSKQDLLDAFDAGCQSGADSMEDIDHDFNEWFDEYVGDENPVGYNPDQDSATSPTAFTSDGPGKEEEDFDPENYDYAKGE